MVPPRHDARPDVDVIFDLACRLGYGDEAVELFHLLNPINHTRTRADVDRYVTEPYVVDGDVYSHPQHAGRGGWSWYTGSAAWMYRAAVESILGLARRGLGGRAGARGGRGRSLPSRAAPTFSGEKTTAGASFRR